jgi:hypothetical protein
MVVTSLFFISTFVARPAIALAPRLIESGPTSREAHIKTGPNETVAIPLGSGQIRIGPESEVKFYRKSPRIYVDVNPSGEFNKSSVKLYEPPVLDDERKYDGELKLSNVVIRWHRLPLLVVGRCKYYGVAGAPMNANKFILEQYEAKGLKRTVQLFRDDLTKPAGTIPSGFSGTVDRGGNIGGLRATEASRRSYHLNAAPYPVMSVVSGSAEMDVTGHMSAGNSYTINHRIVTGDEKLVLSMPGRTITIGKYSEVIPDNAMVTANGSVLTSYICLILDDDKMHSETSVEINENQALMSIKTWLSSFRLSSRNRHLTLGGKGTHYIGTVDSSNSAEPDGITVNEQDPDTARSSWVEVYLDNGGRILPNIEAFQTKHVNGDGLH